MEIARLESNEVMATVSRWEEAGDQWHFHMLPPTCAFSPTPLLQHCILLENRTCEATFGVFSAERDMRLGQDLARIIHAEVFSGPPSARTSPRWLKGWTIRMQDLNARRIAWHHHMFFPDCILNRHAGSWVLAFEDAERPVPKERTFKLQPKSVFEIIEHLYWAQV